MNILLIVVIVVAVVLLVTGGFVQSLNFLLWVGIVLLVIGYRVPDAEHRLSPLIGGTLVTALFFKGFHAHSGP